MFPSLNRQSGFSAGLLKGLRPALFGCALIPGLVLGASESPWPEKAQDPLYGEALYHYHQGQAFEALTILNVAKQKGGIKGHGGHPLLVEGGLMLAYGMTRSAQAHFESVLAEELSERVPPEVRNQAWFYLGKVYYLEQDGAAAIRALEQVDVAQLEQQDPALYEEWFYLRVQLALTSNEVSTTDSKGEAAENLSSYTEFWISKLPKASLWRFYLRYNQIIREIHDGAELALVSNALENLLQELEALTLLSDADNKEREALSERLRLSLGQLYLQHGLYDAASRHLKKSSLNGPFAEQALFQFAIAAAHQEQFGLALSALKRLESRKALFTPWLDQLPYALAYLYEQLDDLPLALQAYQSAAERYDQQIEKLEMQRSGLDEGFLLEALATPFSRDETGVSAREYRDVALGSEQLENDAYGRLQVLPEDFALAQLIADEDFQLGLRDLHELYRLKNSLVEKERHLQSFELMLETRAQQRQHRLTAVSQTLEEQNAEQWFALQQAYAKQIERALEQEDARFFMTEEQLEFADVIGSIKENLALLPDDEDKREYQQKLSRAEAFFNWWLEDQYSANRWQAEKQLIGLNRAMEEFGSRHKSLREALDDQAFQADLEQRVASVHARLQALHGELERALEVTRVALLSKVDRELERQLEEVRQYRLASRHALARLSDQLYRDQLPQEVKSDATALGSPSEESEPDTAALNSAEDIQEGAE